MRACSEHGCERKHYARGFCQRHYVAKFRKEAQSAYWRNRYANDSKFRESVQRRSKEHYLQNQVESEYRVAIWRAMNPERAKANDKKAHEKHKREKGVGRSARYIPGRPCKVHAGGKDVWGEIEAPAFRSAGVWSIWVKLPWGEVVLFPTKEVRV